MIIKRLLLGLCLIATSALATDIPLYATKGPTKPTLPFPNGATCGANEAIQSISSNGLVIACVTVGGGQVVPGSDQEVLYNSVGIMAADQYLKWDYTNQILQIGNAGTSGTIKFAGVPFASLGTPSDGTTTYCSNCAPGTTPCTGASTGSLAVRQNGAWSCFAGTGGTLTGSGVANVLAMWTSASNLSTFPVTDDTVPVGNGTTIDAKAVPNCTDSAGNHLNYTAASNAFSCGTSTSGGSGTVTSVAQTVPGGFSISGSPVTTTGTLAIAANGTSGGVLYYSASNTSASSGALTANAMVKGGGAGAAPTSSAMTDDGTTIASGARNFSYAQSLYITGKRAYSTNQSYAAADRLLDCTSGGSAISYTLPAATGSGIILDIFKVDSGAGTCTIVRTGSDHINTSSGTTRTLSNQADGDTCRDYASAQWICRGSGTTS